MGASRPAEAAQPAGAAARGSSWLLLPLGACLLAIVGGLVTGWNIAADPLWYRGFDDESSWMTMQLVITLVPPVVSAGIIGAIAVGVVWAVSGRRGAP